MNIIPVYFGEKKDKIVKAKYIPSKIEGHLETALRKHKLSLNKPEQFDFSEYPLTGDEPLITRTFSDRGAEIEYQRWINDGLYNRLKSCIKKGYIKTLVEITSSPINTWETIDFSNSQSRTVNLYFGNGRLNHTDIWSEGVDILEDGMQKALRQDIGFTKELMENNESFDKRLKKVETLRNAKKDIIKNQLESYCEEHNLPEIVVEQHKYSGGYSIKNNVILGYLLSSHCGNPFDTMNFIKYLRSKKVPISDEKIIAGFTDATIENQEYFINQKLKNAEKIGRGILEARINGEQKDFDFTGKDKLVEEFEEAIGYRELFSSDKEKAQYITGLVDGIFLGALKKAGK